MNSGSGQRLSVEELKQLNQPPQSASIPPAHPTQQEWDELLAALIALYRLESTNSGRLERLEASVAAQEALLRALGRQAGQAPHPVPAGGAGAGCGPNEGGSETGWEKERAFCFSAQSGDSPVRSDLAGPDFAGHAGGHGSPADDLVRLGRALERGTDTDPVRDATTAHQHTDKKALRREKEKKIALGHKEDDHEEEPTWQQTMS